MTENPFVAEAEEETGGHGGPVERAEDVAKKVVLAGIGALVTAVDEAEVTFDRLVDRGHRAEEEWRRRAEELREGNIGAPRRVRDYLRTSMNMLLDTVNVPNKADVDTINVKLNILMRKVDDLQIQQVGVAPEPPLQVEPVEGAVDPSPS